MWYTYVLQIFILLRVLERDKITQLPIMDLDQSTSYGNKAQWFVA